ncbi:HIRAN domain-containing protein [Heliorestis convoluta]|uniref:HIRAN domain-containing protein n=1 Tax=Heliorestis convoluta TaxID=356322 RepID=A0A5Q2N8N2_9FIRM|nr:HIRAN domain-containing protein [Heliorestis convoluta]QGG48855.1 hypothetical protein FTV88_2766 [Heliorestis convoluta]
MSNAEVLWLAWQNPRSRQYYHVGTLTLKNDQYTFTYTWYEKAENRKLEHALQDGYSLHPSFPDRQRLYISHKLFPAFDRRLPSIDRLDFDSILSDLGLTNNCSKMDLLRRTRGRIANDTYSFEEPIFIDDNGNTLITCFVHGMRHQKLPSDWQKYLSINDSVHLMQEPENPSDPNAIAIYTHSGLCLGYVPAFYTEALNSLLNQGAKIRACIEYVNEKATAHWWVKIKCISTPFSIEENANKETKRMLSSVLS